MGRVTKEELALLAERGLTEVEMAEEVGVTARTINRTTVHYGFREPRATLIAQPELLERARVWAAEGMPLVWIAEDIGFDASTIGDHVARPEDANLEWKRVWQSIRNNAELLKIHDEIAPTPRNRRRA